MQVLKGKQDERTARAFVKEMSILKSCLHPQILQYMVRPCVCQITVQCLDPNCMRLRRSGAKHPTESCML